MKFDNVDLLRKVTKHIIDLNIFKLLEYNLGFLKKVDDNTKAKMGDFYDPINNIYYDVKVYLNKIYIMPNSDIDMNKNAIVVKIYSDGFSSILAFGMVGIIKNGSLMIEDYNGDEDSCNFYYYDEDSLKYAIENKILTDYDNITSNSYLGNNVILPDIEVNTSRPKHYSPNVYGLIVHKKIICEEKEERIECANQGYYAHKPFQINAINEYKEKKKILLP